MPDNTINIGVQVENENLQTFIDLFNQGLLTTKEYVSGVKELSASFKAGSQDMIDLKNFTGQVSDKMREATGRTSEFTQALRDSRAEHRLGMFVMMEAVRTLDAFGMKNKEVQQTLTTGAEAYFGVSFALSAMGGEAAKVATPVGIAVGALLTLKTVADNVNKSLEESFDRVWKVNQELGIITPSQTITALNAQLEKLKSEASSAGAPSAWQWIQAVLGGVFTEGGSGVAANRIAQANINSNLAAQLETTKQIYDAQDKNIKLEKAKVENGSATLVQLRGMIQSYRAMADTQQRQLDLSNQQWEVQNKIDEQAQKNQDEKDRRLKEQNEATVKYLNEENEAQQKLFAEQEKWLKKYEEEQKKILMAPDEPAKKFLEESKKNEESIKKWIPTDAFHTASLGIVKDIENIITGTQNASQVWQSFGQTAVQVIEEVIDKLVIMAAEEALVAALLSIFTGGIGAIPGVMQSGASGEGVFGGGPVPMFDNNLNQIQNLHQTINSIQGGGGKNNSQSVSVHPIITSQGLAVQVAIGQQQRRGRTM